MNNRAINKSRNRNYFILGGAALLVIIIGSIVALSGKSGNPSDDGSDPSPSPVPPSPPSGTHPMVDVYSEPLDASKFLKSTSGQQFISNFWENPAVKGSVVNSVTRVGPEDAGVQIPNAMRDDLQAVYDSRS